MRIVYPFALFLVLGMLGACIVVPDPDFLDDDDDTATDDDDATDAEPCTDPDDPENWIVDPPDEWAVAASFVLPNGDPVRNLMITLCGTACYNEPTNCEGVVYFPFADPDTYVIEPLFAYNLEFDRWSRSFDFLDYDGTGQVDLSGTPFSLPEAAEIEPLGTGPQERIFSSGLEVRYNGDEVELPFGPEVGTLGAVEIPAAQHPVGGLMDWTADRVWALAIWDLEVELAEHPAGFQVVAPMSAAVPDGAEAAFLVANYDYGIVEGTFVVVPAEIAADRMSINTPANAGIDRTTLWIAAWRMP